MQERRPPAETQARQQAATPSFTLDDLARALSTNQLDDTQDARAAAFAAHEKSLIDALVDGMKKAPQHAALDVLGGARDDTPALRYAQSAYADTSDGGSDEDAADDPDDTRYAI